MKKTAKTKRWMKCLNVVCFLVVIAPLGQSASSGEKGLNQAPEGFVALFNGKDLTGWKGLLARDYDNPIKRAKLSPEALAMEQARADKSIREHWIVKDGVLEFDGKGFSLATLRDYEDFEMLVDWKIVNPRGDSGIYLRGTPQVQIWDPDQHKVGSGGLYNNKKNPSKPAAGHSAS
ncbi:MAG: 3-keto-disaccharide hydrolase [Planctomycetota bacterium]